MKGTGRLPFSPADPQELKRRQAAIKINANTYFMVSLCRLRVILWEKVIICSIFWVIRLALFKQT